MFSSGFLNLSDFRHRFVICLGDKRSCWFSPMTLPEKFPVRVAVCVGQWLPPSETFIYDQLIRQKRTRARVIARDRTDHATRFPYEDVVNLGRFEQMAYYHLGFDAHVKRALTEHRTEVIHAHFGVNGTMVLGAARQLGLPLVVSLHGHDVGGLEPQNRRTMRYARYQRLAPNLFDYASRFLCASKELSEMLVAHGAPEHKVGVHYLGVDGNYFCPPRRDIRATRNQARILMVGRLVEKKGIDDGLLAFSRVAHKFRNCEMVIIGDGPLRARLRSLAESIGIGERVAFRGVLTPSEVLREMQEASLLLTPSRTTAAGDRESGVIVVKEAGATGLPTLATRHGGLPEIVEHGRSGFLVDERDVDRLADRLEELLSSPSLRATMGEEARKIVLRRYNAHVQNEALEEELISIARATRSNGRAAEYRLRA